MVNLRIVRFYELLIQNELYDLINWTFTNFYV